MPKIKATLTAVCYYDMEMENYPGGVTIPQALEIDRENFLQEPNFLLESAELTEINFEVVDGS